MQLHKIRQNTLNTVSSRTSPQAGVAISIDKQETLGDCTKGIPFGHHVGPLGPPRNDILVGQHYVQYQSEVCIFLLNAQFRGQISCTVIIQILQKMSSVQGAVCVTSSPWRFYLVSLSFYQDS